MACNLLKRSGCAVLPVYITQGGDFLCGDNLADIKNYSGGKIPLSSRACFAKGGIYVLSKRGKPKKFLPVYCALNCCHGGWGEGGGISGLCLAMSIPLASAGVFESSALIDKYLTKILMKGLGVPTVEYLYLRDMGGATHVKDFPVMVKPARLGSSIGISVAEDRARLAYAIEAAFAYDGTVIAEKYLEDRREINCACYRKGDELVVSACEEPKTSHRILTFADKYLDGGKQRASGFPAEIPEECADRVQSYTKLLYRRTDLRGIVRADFLLSGGDVYFNEMNTVPGSLAWYLFCGRMADFTRLLTVLVEQGICDFRDGANKKLLKNCGVLSAVPRGKARR